MDKIYDYQGNILNTGVDDINCKIIAHRGYYAKVEQNTIESFKDAAENGFSWIEMDIRKTADSMYVMAHDDSVTMYNNGTATSLKISESNYSTIKTYTWDSAGKYKLCSLQAVFNAMKLYNMKMICDLKNGANSDVMEIASMCGAVDRIMLSYKSSDSVDLYKKYDSVPIRIYPSNYDTIINLQNETVNPIYADFNAQGDYEAISVALSAGIPIIFSGCTLDNAPIWQVLANGVMANSNLNISYDDFVSVLNVNYDVVSTITPSVFNITVSVGETASISATSDVSSAGGYVYGYTINPKIATVLQNTWGSSVSFTVTGVATGSTILRLFTGSGEIVDIPVEVS